MHRHRTTNMTKSQEDRLKEVIDLYAKLKDLGLSDDVCPALKKFREVANTFVREGYSSEGKIKLEEIERSLCYRMSMQSHIDSYVVLKKY